MHVQPWLQLQQASTESVALMGRGPLQASHGFMALHSIARTLGLAESICCDSVTLNRLAVNGGGTQSEGEKDLFIYIYIHTHTLREREVAV